MNPGPLGARIPGSRPGLRGFFVCLSAASLLFLKTWGELFPLTDMRLIRGIVPRPEALVALWGLILLLSCSALWVHSRIRSQRFGVLASLGAAALVLAAMTPSMARILVHLRAGSHPPLLLRGPGLAGWAGAGLVLAAGAVLAGCLRPRGLQQALAALFLVLSPFPFLATFTILKGMPGAVPRADMNLPIPASLPHRPVKAIVLIFDEWDFEYAFPARPGYLHLPNIDRFAGEYGQYTHCWPTAGETYRSLPALATGQIFSEATPGPGLQVRLQMAETGAWTTWSQQDDLFTSVAKLGWSTRMIQWLHVPSASFLERRPGLSIFHGGVYLDWKAADDAYLTLNGSLRRILTSFNGIASDYARMAHPSDSSRAIRAKIEFTNAMVADLYGTLATQRTDLVWAHLPMPHSPAIWDARHHRVLDHQTPGVSNLDNMELADQVLGEVRRILESQGTWDGALVILTSDHWQRKDSGDHLPPNPGKYERDEGLRVPLLVKWPRQHTSWTVDDPVCTRSIRRMVETAALGQSPGQAFRMDPPPAGLRTLLLKERPL